MADRRPTTSRGLGGYLSRLVEATARPRTGAAHLPRQLAWGPPRPAPTDSSAAEPELMDIPRPVAHPRPPARAAHPEQSAQRPAEPDQIEPEPAPVPASPATLPLRPNVIGGRSDGPPPTLEPHAAVQRATPAAVPEPRVPVAVPIRPSAPIHTAPVEQPTVTTAPPPQAAPNISALERLAARSLALPNEDDTNAVRPPVPARPAHVPRGAPNPPRPTSAPLPAAPAVRRATPREPEVRIGTIEVTIASPSPPPVAAFPAPARKVVIPAPAPAGRLSRPLSGYGLGQG